MSILTSAGLNLAHTNTTAGHASALVPVAGELLVVPAAESAVAGVSSLLNLRLKHKSANSSVVEMIVKDIQ